MEARRRAGAWALPQCLPFQEEAGAAVLGTSDDRRAGEPAVGERAPVPAASSLAQDKAAWTAGEACLAPCSTEGAPAPKVPCAEASLGGDPGIGLRPRAEVRG